MTVKACIRIILISILSYNYTLAQKASANEIESLISQTWYSYEVGDPELREMNPTKNHEQLSFNPDGSVKYIVLHKVMGKMEYVASWEYNDVDNTIDLEIDLDGQKERQTVTIEKIDEKNMILISPQKITSYSTSISDAFKESDETASSSAETLGIDLDAWTGAAEFNEAAIIADDKRTETYPSKGQVKLIREGDDLQIEVSENGYVDLYTVSQGSLSMGGHRQYVIITDIPELAGGFLFSDDGKVFYYNESRDSTVEYYMKEE